MHRNPNASFLHMGPSVKETELKKTVHDWKVEQRKYEIFLSTWNIIRNALKNDASFKAGGHKMLSYWVYSFLV